MFTVQSSYILFVQCSTVWLHHIPNAVVLHLSYSIAIPAYMYYTNTVRSCITSYRYLQYSHILQFVYRTAIYMYMYHILFTVQPYITFHLQYSHMLHLSYSIVMCYMRLHLNYSIHVRVVIYVHVTHNYNVHVHLLYITDVMFHFSQSIIVVTCYILSRVQLVMCQQNIYGIHVHVPTLYVHVDLILYSIIVICYISFMVYSPVLHCILSIALSHFTCRNQILNFALNFHYIVSNIR